MRTMFLGSPVDILTMAETVAIIDSAIRQRRPVRQVSLNVAKLVKMKNDAELRHDVESADMISIDGMGIAFGLRMLGTPVPERVAGVDLMMAVLQLCAEKGYRPYFLGARQDVVREATAAVLRRNPQISFAGAHDGYFKPEEEPLVVGDINQSGADCLFIGMPTPAKERFLAKYSKMLATPYIMGVGGSFDILSGRITRAPDAVQRAGLEWAYRIYQEPKRMWWRYASTNSDFAWLMIKALFEKFFMRRGKPSTGSSAGK
jgi:N-acetylglucosaminyldiphosphoundecaprenol N-acetyl-beta-D-mannosaminyltransferase